MSEETILEPALSLETAKALMEAAEAEAVKRDLRLVFAVMDQHGNLKLFHRMDGTSSGSILASQQKAYTAACFPFSTRQLAERSESMEANPYGGGSIPGFLLLEGGEPLFGAEGRHLGGLGISGATPQLDGEVARAAITSVGLHGAPA